MQQSLLKEKLNEFIRKYYKALLAKGLVLSVGVITAYFLLIAFLEYFFWLSTFARAALFFSFVALLLFLIGFYMVIPGLKLLGIGQRISYEQAAKIIGNHFPDIQDKLLNTLQLQEKLGAVAQGDLLLAEVENRTKRFSQVKFSLAVNYNTALKFGKYAVIPLAVFVFIFFVNPKIFQDSSKRIINYTQYFEPEAPFKFLLNESLLTLNEGEDLPINVLIEGDVIPTEVFLVYRGSELKMKSQGGGSFFYILKNVKESANFKFEAAGFSSKIYKIEALPKSIVSSYVATVSFPNYTGKTKQEFRNQTELKVPEGSKVEFTFNTKQTDKLVLKRTNTNGDIPLQKSDSFFTTSITAAENEGLTFYAGNKKNAVSDSVKISLTVIKDAFPSIVLTGVQKDTAKFKFLSFNGKIEDDYGFTALSFSYRIKKSDKASNSERGFLTMPVDFNKELLNQQFFFYWALDTFNFKAGEVLEYFFTVTDNDRYNGLKSSRTTTERFSIPNKEELSKRKDETVKKLDKDFQDALKKQKELTKEIEALTKELAMKKELNWQDKEKIKDLLSKQQQLQNQIDKMQDEQKNLLQMREQFDMANENLLEKQRMLNELFEKVFDDETKKLFEELEKLLDQNDLKDLQDQLEKFQFSAQDLEKELDRNLELFKSLEVEQKFLEIADDLKSLAEQQKELAEEAKDGSTDNKELKEKQDALAEKFDELMEEFKENLQKNEELETPHKIDDFNEQSNDIKKEQQKAGDNLDKGDKKKAGENQKKAGDKMEEMADAMENQMEAGGMEQMGEDAEALRVLLNNIVKLSFDQESLMLSQITTPTNDPKYNQLASNQKKLEGDGRMVRDSLEALAKRVPQIQSFVGKELNDLIRNTNKSVSLMADRNAKDASISQQYAMTSLNNLALMLSEALENMQQQMNNKGSGSGSCKKPSSGDSKTPAQMRALQEAISKQMEQLKKQMEQQGNNPEGKQRGGQMSEEIAKLAAKQGALRKEVQKMAQQLNSDGSGSGNGLNEIAKQMEENEKDLVNKNLNIESFKRQQDILSRLLEHEKAERERELDEKRRSNQGDLGLKSNPPEFLEYKEKKQKQTELLETLPPTFKTYYKVKINDYFNQIEP
ncbi:MAG: DUF4175 family protein [Luteibaculaceae bacterium]